MSKLIINYNVQISEKISKLFETSEQLDPGSLLVKRGKGECGGGVGAQSSLYANLFPPLAMARLGQPHPH